MKNIKYAFHGLSTRIGVSIIILIQVTVALYFLNSAILVQRKYREDKEQLLSIYNGVKPFRLLVSNKEAQVDSNKAKEFRDYLRNNDRFKIVVITDRAFHIENFKGDGKFIDFKYNDYNVGDGYSAIKNIGFDSNFLEFFKLPVDEGRFLNKEDFNRTDVVPIVLGSNYRERYKLGDEFKAKDNIHNKIYKYKVIGFLKEDSYCLESTQQVETINLNNYMLLPYMDSFIDTEEDAFHLSFYSTQGAIFSKHPEKNMEYFNEIRSKSEEMDLYKYKYYSSEEQFKEFEGFVKSDIEQSTMIFSIVLLFCSIGIITSILSSIDTRTTEFGIHLLCGAKISDIILRIVLETSMIIGCSFLFIASINIFKFKDMKSTPYLLIFSLGTIMFLTIIPVIKLMRFHVNDIIRGKE